LRWLSINFRNKALSFQSGIAFMDGSRIEMSLFELFGEILKPVVEYLGES